MNRFPIRNGPFTDHHEDLNSDPFNFEGAEWNAMISAPYEDGPGMNLSNGKLKNDHSSQPPANQYLSADSPQGYDPSSGVSSPGLSDHNMDTLSSTSLEDRNDFDNLINYDGEANVDGTDCLSKSYWHSCHFGARGGSNSVWGS